MATSVFTPGLNRVAFGMIDNRVRLRLRQDRALRRAQAGRQGARPVPRAGRRADHPGPLPLQAGGHRGGPVRRRLRRPGAVQEARQVLDPRGHQGRREDRRRPRPDQRGRARPTTASPTSASACRRTSRPTRWPRPRATSPRSTRASRPTTCTSKSFADVVGKKPVALLSSRRRSCASRASAARWSTSREQMKSQYGKQVEFIHQEVYENNDPKQGPARAARAAQPGHRAVAVRGRQGRAHHRPARGVVRSPPFEKALKTALCDPRLRPRARAALEPADP